MSKLVVLSPGRFPVVHSISVTEADEITQGIPSITILLSVITEEKPVPVNLTAVPPTTVPNLGEIEISFGVKVLVNFTLFAILYSAP